MLPFLQEIRNTLTSWNRKYFLLVPFLRRTYLVELLITCLSSCSDDEELPKDGTTVPSTSPMIVDEPAEPDVAPRVTMSSVKKIRQTRRLLKSLLSQTMRSYMPVLLGIVEEIRRLGH
jgi:hypothetical protein